MLSARASSEEMCEKSGWREAKAPKAAVFGQLRSSAARKEGRTRIDMEPSIVAIAQLPNLLRPRRERSRIDLPKAANHYTPPLADILPQSPLQLHQIKRTKPILSEHLDDVPPPNPDQARRFGDARMCSSAEDVDLDPAKSRFPDTPAWLAEAGLDAGDGVLAREREPEDVGGRCSGSEGIGAERVR